MRWAREAAPAVDPVDALAAGRKGSILAARAAAKERATGRSGSTGGHKLPPADAHEYPTNEEVVKAVQERVEAKTFNAAPVVTTLKAALLDDPSVNTLAFSAPDQVLAYLGNRIVRPIWTDPVCGDGRCEAPWEFPAWGPFGCRADCGRNPNTTAVLVAVTADFVGHPSLSPRALMAAVRWNLCRDDAERRLRGDPDLCWFEDDQVFTQYQETQIQSVSLVDGTWYVRVHGDYAGRVKGTIYYAPPAGAAPGTSPEALPTEPVWTSCLTKRRSSPPSSSTTTPTAAAVRRLQEAIGRLQDAAGGKEGARLLLSKAVTQAFHGGRQRQRSLDAEAGSLELTELTG